MKRWTPNHPPLLGMRAGALFAAVFCAFWHVCIALWAITAIAIIRGKDEQISWRSRDAVIDLRKLFFDSQSPFFLRTRDP